MVRAAHPAFRDLRQACGLSRAAEHTRRSVKVPFRALYRPFRRFTEKLFSNRGKLYMVKTPRPATRSGARPDRTNRFPLAPGWQMKRKIGNYIITAFIINVFAIMSVGGLCILLVKDMVNNISTLEDESQKISETDEVNAKIHQMIIALHHSVIQSAPGNMLEAIRIIRELSDDFAAPRHGQSSLGGNDAERVLRGKIHLHLSEMNAIMLPVQREFSENGTVDQDKLQDLEELANSVQYLTGMTKKSHFDIISELVNDSYEKMYFILFLYLMASFVGILASCVGYFILTRHTISPLKKLAVATRSVASGDFSTKVETSSQTEIGSLYESFNIMTEKLQQHEKRREDFSRELEQKVTERTSELRKANKSLKVAQTELIRMEKIATLGQIATSVNHEIKTPLNSLYMNLQLLAKQIRKYTSEDEEARSRMLEVAAVIDGEISRINGILEEFVKYARFSPPELKQNDLNKLLEEIAGMISQNARQAGVDIQLSLAEGVSSILLDRKKMTQALLNLCVNAIQAMPAGGTLAIRSEKKEGKVLITISDTGQGITAEDIGRIFDPFFTRKEGGLGFGLPIVQRIIEDHKGQITCTSRVGEYTAFEIILPEQLLA
jgi:signal transduction histidine kinase